ncbi:MAG TPA: hypothetical protein VNH46_05035, partial [Gemmatimonadales bacterium]|nr:hypothetical protein [Gemmatimonadales bacterium]
GEDRDVLRLNRRAFAELRCPKHLVVIPGATHLFEEPGALEQAAHHAADWFRSHLPAGAPAGTAPDAPYGTAAANDSGTW